jgi:methionyl-tRNA formyltransferase
MKKIIFFGGGKFLIDLINIVKKKNIKHVVFTSPRHSREIVFDRLNFKNCLKKNNTNFYTTEKLNEELLKKEIKGTNCIGVSIGSPWIFKKHIIKIFESRLYNIHGANLPLDRGGGGFSWQILQNKSKGYSCLHKVNEKIDNGDIIQTLAFDTKSFNNPVDWQNEYLNVSTNLFKKNLNLLFNKKIKLRKQMKKNSTYWPRMDTESHGWINWNWSGEEILNFIQAFDKPYAGAHTQLNKKTFYFKNCKFVKKKQFHPFQYGLIINKTKKNVIVCTNNGLLHINNIFSKQGKKIDFKIFKVGDRFFTPIKKLEDALTKRVYFNL